MISRRPNIQDNLLKLLLIFAISGGVIALILIFIAPSMERNAWFLGYSKPRILLGVIILAVLVILGIITGRSFSSPNYLEPFNHWLDHKASFPAWLLTLSTLHVLAIFSGGALLYLRYTGGVFFSTLLSPRLDNVVSTIVAVLSRSEPLLIWIIFLFALSLFFLAVKYTPIYIQKGFFDWPTIYKILLFYLMVPVTLFHWVILYFQLYVFIAIPHWFWKFYTKPSQSDHLFIYIFLLSLAISAAIWLKPRHAYFYLALLVLLGYLLQIGFGFIEGGGFEALRVNFIEKGHHGYAQFACTEPNLVEFIQEYDTIALNDSFFMTKPPGVVSFYIVLQKVIQQISPLDNFDARYSQLTTIMAFAFPMLAALVLLPLYHFSKKYLPPEDAILPGLMFIVIPAVVLTPLYLDQELYPLLFMTCLIGITNTISRRSMKWAFGTGAGIYFVLFFSFSLLPLIPLSATWIWTDYLLNRKCKTFKNTLFLSLGLTAGFLLGHLAFLVFLDYDIIVRYSNALAQHRLHKEYLSGFHQIKDAIYLNNIEAAAWLGFPFVILLLASFVRTGINFLSKQTNKLNILMAASFITFTALNIFGQTRSEVARLWIFMMPLASLFTADEIRIIFKNPLRSKNNWNLTGFLLIISLQLITIFMTFKYQDLD
jgi:hypothetical protein